jgi:2-polyprenyl-6-methoxyphenol hydroxylase-like FAD-dependent oxidoreductase
MAAKFIDIVIVGAGPTGLMLANQLTRFDVNYLIVDQKSGPTEQSRALVVQARSMEIYEQLGLSEHIITDGQASNGICFYKNGKLKGTVTLINPGEKASPFPYIMMYEQSKNETLLYNNILKHNKEVKWNTTVVSIEKENDLYSLECKQNDNTISYQCKYLIACDGTKSIVRDFSQVAFTGGTYLNVFYVADTHVKAGFNEEKLSLFLSKHRVTMLFPMKGSFHFRALGILPKEYYNRTEISFEEILDKVKTEMEMPVEFYDTNWHSTYKLHHKKVERFSKDNIYFTGDAAHVHSPAGGQGMNTGLQDAYNLGWKLALVNKGKAAPALLETYHEERNPVATDLLKTTDRLFAAMIKDNFWYSLLRMYLVPFFVPLISKSRSVQRQLFLLVSQIKIAYLSSSLSKGKAGKIRAGMRLPYFMVTSQNIPVSIYYIVNSSSTPFTVLLFNVQDTNFSLPDKDLFSIITLEKIPENEESIKNADMPESFVAVIRPDNYIAYIDTTVKANEIDNFIKKAYFFTTV